MPVTQLTRVPVVVPVRVVTNNGPTGPAGPAVPSWAEDGEDSWAPGPPGTPGAAGAASTVPGPQGPQSHGPYGDDGDDGWPGAPGNPGIQGGAGAAGPQGPQSHGPYGDDGDDGWPGAPGNPGVQGGAGAAGPQGPQSHGPIGEDGEDSWVPGPPGPPGVGATGPTGPTGPSGNSITNIFVSGSTEDTGGDEPLGICNDPVLQVGPGVASLGGLGALTESQILIQTATYTLLNQTATQKLFNSSTNGAVTVAGNTTYMFESLISLTSLSATSGTFSFGFAGTCTVTDLFWVAVGFKGISGASGTANFSWHVNSAAEVVVVASTATAGSVWVRGILRVNAGGTLIPQIAQSQAAAAVVGVDSFFRLWPVGLAATKLIGNWS